MRTISIALLAFGLVLATAPVAVADEITETQPDCEEGQKWIGYTKTEDVRQIYDETFQEPPRASTCEGEHWDGQDNTGNDAAPGTGTGCASDVDSDTRDKDGGLAWCKGDDPNAGGPDALNPFFFRVSFYDGDFEEDERKVQYVSIDIYGVGRAAVHNEVGEHDTLTAVYLRDNSDQVAGGQNVLAGAVSALGITQGYAGEGDCTQEQYQKAAETGHRPSCTRDNTAITVTTLLP